DLAVTRGRVDPTLGDHRLSEDRLSERVGPERVAGVDVEAVDLAGARRDDDLRTGDRHRAERAHPRLAAARPERRERLRAARGELAAHRLIEDAGGEDRPRALEAPHLLPVVHVARDVAEPRRGRGGTAAEDRPVAGRDRDGQLLAVSGAAEEE